MIPISVLEVGVNTKNHCSMYKHGRFLITFHGLMRQYLLIYSSQSGEEMPSPSTSIPFQNCKYKGKPSGSKEVS